MVPCDPVRQHPACHRSGGAQTGDGEHAELHQTGEIAEQQYAVAHRGGQDSQPQRRPDVSVVAGHGPRGMAERMNGIVQGDSQQGDAEGQRDAVNAAEQRDDRGGCHHHAACHRQRGQQHHTEGPVAEPQDQPDAETGQDRQPPAFRSHGLARGLPRTRPDRSWPAAATHQSDHRIVHGCSSARPAAHRLRSRRAQVPRTAGPYAHPCSSTPHACVPGRPLAQTGAAPKGWRRWGRARPLSGEAPPCWQPVRTAAREARG